MPVTHETGVRFSDGENLPKLCKRRYCILKFTFYWLNFDRQLLHLRAEQPNPFGNSIYRWQNDNSLLWHWPSHKAFFCIRELGWITNLFIYSVRLSKHQSKGDEWPSVEIQRGNGVLLVAKSIPSVKINLEFGGYFPRKVDQHYVFTLLILDA